MTTTTIDRKPLRLLPGIILAVILSVSFFILPLFGGSMVMNGLLGAVVAGVLIALWWLLLSRAPWLERIGAILLMVIGVIIARRFVDLSMSGLGQGFAIYFLPMPGLMLALVVWAVVTRSATAMTRRALLVVAIAVALVPWLMLRTNGVVGAAGFDFEWRWTPTAEEILLAKGEADPTPIPVPAPAPPVAVAETPKEAAPAKPEEKPVAAPAPAAAAPASPKAPEAAAAPGVAEWPGFRGPRRDGVIRDVRIKTDWAASPPVELWKRAVGPGWSSFAVQGDLIYTQEQRGDDELVSCYRLSTGEPVWRHRDHVRFYESNGGAGPRATPTLADGRVYTSGATGILNALDARTGAVIWSHNFAAEAKQATPIWGFTASPIVVGDLVIASVSGTLAAFDRVTGQQRWLNKSRGGTYSSPHRATFDGVEQVVLLAGPGVMSVSPSDGKLLWEHAWDGGPVVQPGITEDGVIINAITATGGVGTRRLAITHDGGEWKVEERWTSNGLKPYFNDFVIHKGHAYGFDNSILSSINLETGQRNWKGGRYGNGQLVLLADQDLLLVISEEGELALVSATTDGYKEIAKVPALDAKTWNHPVLVGDTLLIRNGEEMKAFRLALDRAQPTER